jgi:hypothetical protein
MNVLKTIRMAMVVLTLGVVASLAHAQDRQPETIQVANTVWMGTENLKGFSKLGFAFRADGTVMMADARTRDNDPKTMVRGTYVQNGADVEIRFADCVYRGRITGQQLAGTARFNNGNSWNFQVQYMPAQPSSQPK